VAQASTALKVFYEHVGKVGEVSTQEECDTMMTDFKGDKHMRVRELMFGDEVNRHYFSDLESKYVLRQHE